jgi:hypothetical protein
MNFGKCFPKTIYEVKIEILEGSEETLGGGRKEKFGIMHLIGSGDLAFIGLNLGDLGLYGAARYKLICKKIINNHYKYFF